MARSALAWLLLAFLSTGCRTPKPAPSLNRLELSGGVATWRAYGDPDKASICEAEPRFLLDELASVNGALTRFLDATTTPEGTAVKDAWPDEKIDQFEEGLKALPDLLTQHEANVKQAADCAFAKTGGYPLLLKRSRELAKDARGRLDTVPKEIAQARAARALEQWQHERLDAQEAARRGCPSKPSSSPLVYFAFTDDRGVTEWLFCDGALVRQEGQGEPAFEAAPSEIWKGKRAPKSAAYLAAAKKYPAESISKAPAGAPASGANALPAW
ncbi:MAG: hypothetical protein AB1730_00865 [Myxococcota bacterium]